ncbi:MAG: glutamate--cysteine ligase [Candidatus Nanopelagicales bacterium]
MDIAFQASPQPTLGVEWEIALVDAVTGDLASRADEVLDLVGDLVDDGIVHRELLRNTAELVTPVCHTVAEAMAHLAGGMRAVRTAAESLDLRLFSAGMHPFADSEAQKVTDAQRYDTLMDRTRWWGQQMVIYGVHVHVGMPDRDRVMPVLDSMLRYFPHLQALSASSPFYEGEDTGYASNRALLFQQLPTAGLPFQFATWAEYEKYVEDLTTTGVIDVINEIRWDVRPSPRLGTIETRICDAMPSFEFVAATTALTHCLLVDLDTRLAAGESLPTLPPWHVQENKWRAARYGMDAIIITSADNDERLVSDDLADLLERLAPVAQRLGCQDELALVATILDGGASYAKQRAVAAEADGDLRPVVDLLVAELSASLDRQ